MISTTISPTASTYDVSPNMTMDHNICVTIDGKCILRRSRSAPGILPGRGRPTSPEHPAEIVSILTPTTWRRGDRDLVGNCRVGREIPPSKGEKVHFGGPIDLITEGVEGFLVPIDDARALADKANAILATPDADWRKMSDAAYARQAIAGTTRTA
jgi:hypothetical protein